jgi:hypothetical protein
MATATKVKRTAEPELEINAKLKGVDDIKNWDWNSKASKKKKVDTSHGSAGALYFVGFIGALVYWMQAAVGFGAVVTGFLKALVWPAYIVYKLLESFYGVVI